MIEKLEGVIISDKTYSESSKIINIITKEHGVIGVLCKGAKRIKSGMSGTTTKLTYGYFNLYYKEGKLSTLISVDIIDSFKNIKKDITKISYFAFISELVSQVIKHEYNEDIFDLYINSIKKIDEGFDEVIITNILELKLLDYLGIRPSLDECVICKDKTNIVTISPSKGGFICHKCRTNEPIVEEQTIKLIRMLYYIDISKISKTDINDKVKKEVDYFINEYYDQYSGLYLKTKAFIKNIKKFDL